MRLLEAAAVSWETPAVTVIALKDRSPFRVMVSCILSLRTKDTTTGPASARLFALADTADKMLALSQNDIEQAIYPVGFYHTKAGQIIEISRELVENYGGVVPDRVEELLRFKGVGRKTANLVVTLGYGKPGICVDTHVHRICNRWGYISSKNPEETEFRLRDVLPGKYWLRINDLLVAYGQNLCKPVSPHCSTCSLSHLCMKLGVGKCR